MGATGALSSAVKVGSGNVDGFLKVSLLQHGQEEEQGQTEYHGVQQERLGSLSSIDNKSLVKVNSRDFLNYGNWM